MTSIELSTHERLRLLTATKDKAIAMLASENNIKHITVSAKDYANI